jgi:CBS domain-containing protein
MQVHQIMRSKSGEGVVTIAPGASLTQATEILSARRIGALVVSSDGKRCEGILSERDIVRELGRRGPSCLTDRVSAVMTAKVIGCRPEDKADEVLAKMTDGRFRHMPVLTGEVMVGLISIGDVVKARLAELAMEKEALTGMIMGN